MAILLITLAILIILVLGAALLGSTYANIQIAQAAQSAASAAQLANMTFVLDRVIAIIAIIAGAGIIITALLAWSRARAKAPVTINPRPYRETNPNVNVLPNTGAVLNQGAVNSADPMQTISQLMALQMMAQMQDRINNHNNQGFGN